MSTTSLMYTAVSGLEAQQQFLSVIANNLANINTPGFKASRVLFENALSQTLAAPSLASATSPGTNGEQIGLGVNVGTITPLFTQGALQSTGVNTDLAIQGQGFFVVADPNTGEDYYTRDGAFNMETTTAQPPTNMVTPAGAAIPLANMDPLYQNALATVPPTLSYLGTLATASGQSVQGQMLYDPSTGNSDTFPTTGTLGDAIGSINIMSSYISPLSVAAGAPKLSAVASISIDSAGRVNALLEDGSTVAVAQISMQNFSNQEALMNVGQNLYEETPAAGVQFTTAGKDSFASASTNGLGALSPGYLEQSNVDLGTEFSNMIEAQRGLEANAKTITTADEVYQDLINMKR